MLRADHTGLPSGCTILDASGHGASFWSQTARVDVRLTNGDAESFFLKVWIFCHTHLTQGCVMSLL
jgi:hypothetical protein